MRRVLITGAGGFLGGHLVRAALAQGLRVRASDVAAPALQSAAGQGAETRVADLLQRTALGPLFDGVDAVIHAAGSVGAALSPTDLRAANVTATEQVVEAALEARVGAFVHVSSVGVYGLPAHTPIAEDGPKRPQTPYAASLWEGERAVMRAWRERGLPVRVLRKSLCYGPGGRSGIAALVAGVALARSQGLREAPLVDGAPRMHHVHVADVARAALLLLGRDDTVGRAFNCADQAPLSWSDLAARLCEAMGFERRRVPAPPSLLRLLGVLPDRLRRRWNEHLSRLWATRCAEQDLLPMLQPRIDRDLLGYLAGDHAYDTTALAALGFRPHHPRLTDELPDLLRWYRAQRWLPPA
ncbi:MAG: NAD(P)-dependent oxidoreductase [Myxococcales bacterium]|nr:NAD(P)-dependent oxidoreductase [Myxococcales bacterium]